MAKVISSPKTLHDFLKWNPSLNYTTVSVDIANPSGTDFTLVIGTPLVVNLTNRTAVPVASGDEGDTNGFLVSGGPVPLPANSTIRVPALVRGPAVVNVNGLPTLDAAGSEYDIDDLRAELAAMNPPVVVIEEPEVSETQTT